MRTTLNTLLLLSFYLLLAKASLYSTNDTYNGNWQLRLAGLTGVSAMQVAVVDDDNVLIIDKYEQNPLQTNGHPAWGAVYRISTSTVRPLNLQTNSFCAGGSWLANGTMVNIGGDPLTSNHTGPGLNAIRLFNPCGDSDSCDIYESPNIQLDTKRWYPTTIRLSDGSIFIMGGSTYGVYLNSVTANNPTIEYYPRKNIAGYNGTSIPSQFLMDTLTANLFPIVTLLPDDTLFVAANQMAMIYDWRTNIERRLPNIPNGVRITYPLTAGAVLLPLTPENNYTPEMLICGGSTAVDSVLTVKTLDVERPASTQCVRMVLTEQGIAGGWIVEQMPETRIMTDMILMPGGDVLLVNGAKTGTAGYANVPHRIGQSNADNPNYRGDLYRPNAPAGQRFSSAGIPASNIPRMYHSTATLLPSGEVMLSGSNPNYDNSPRRYATEYRAERLSPPYMFASRPALAMLPSNISYNGLFNLTVNLPQGTQLANLSVTLHDLGFATHSVHMSQRMVGLQVISLSLDGTQLVVQGPPTPQIYPPGPAWLYVIVNGIPSAGRKLMVVQSPASPPPSSSSSTTTSTSTSTTSAPLPITTGTGVWKSTASFTTIFITTASVSGRCGAAFGTRTVCQTPLATCQKMRAGYSVCSAPTATSSSTSAPLTSSSTSTSSSSPTTPAPITTGTGVWESTASFTTIQITTAPVNGRCGAAFGTRTVCETPLATCLTRTRAGYSVCSAAAPNTSNPVTNTSTASQTAPTQTSISATQITTSSTVISSSSTSAMTSSSTMTSSSISSSSSSTSPTSSSSSSTSPLSSTTAVPITTGTGVWQSTASFTTIQITTASVNGRCGARFGTRTVCQTPLASCMTKSGAGISTCSPASTQPVAAIRATGVRTSRNKLRQ